MAANATIFVTVRRKSPSAGLDLTQSQRISVIVANIFKNLANTKRGGSVLKLNDVSTRGGSKFEVYESTSQIATAIDPSGTNFAADANLTVAGNAHTIASTTIIANYFNLVTTATVTTADAIRLPAVATPGVYVISNKTGTPILVFPNAAGEAIVDKTGTQLANGLSVSIPVGQTWHFISNGTVNKVAVDA